MILVIGTLEDYAGAEFCRLRAKRQEIVAQNPCWAFNDNMEGVS
jgi:hypothetical protein